MIGDPGRPAPASVPDVWTLFHGVWVGHAAKSPFGPIPYALTFQQADSKILAYTPSLEWFKRNLPLRLQPHFERRVAGEHGQLQLVQRYTFERGSKGARFDFHSELGTSVHSAKLELHPEHCEPGRLVFGRVEGGLESMTVVFQALDAARMSMRTDIHGGLHSDMVLEFRGDGLSEVPDLQ